MIEMTRFTICLAVLLLASGPVLAQPATIDKSYEAQKESEIATARLQLATQPGSTAIQEISEAETALRRLKSTTAPDLRRKIAAELEMSITRLKIAAESRY